jgi:hypothetical protein
MSLVPRAKAIVVDTECPQLHKQEVTLIKKNTRNTAEWEVLHKGKTWIVHTCRLRETQEISWG